MKFIYLIFYCNLSLLGGLQARSEMSEQYTIFRQIAMCLELDNVNQVLIVPERFDEVQSIKEMLKDSPKLLKYLNDLAIVPNTPIIDSNIGQLTGLRKFKLFAISRVPSFDKVMSKQDLSSIPDGRFIFLINMQGNECNPRWVPESEAQYILKQLNGFDPEKEPLAFQDFVKGDVNTSSVKKNLNGNDSSTINSPDPSLPKKSIASKTSGGQNSLYLIWMVVGITVLVSVIGYVIRQARRHARELPPYK